MDKKQQKILDECDELYDLMQSFHSILTFLPFMQWGWRKRYRRAVEIMQGIHHFEVPDFPKEFGEAGKVLMRIYREEGVFEKHKKIYPELDK